MRSCVLMIATGEKSKGGNLLQLAVIARRCPDEHQHSNQYHLRQLHVHKTTHRREMFKMKVETNRQTHCLPSKGRGRLAWPVAPRTVFETPAVTRAASDAALGV